MDKLGLMNIQLGENNTIKSTDLVDIINVFREIEGERAELQHKNFMAKIKREHETLKSLGLDNGLNFKLVEYIDLKGEKRPCYELNRDGMLQMLNSESTLVRFKTIEYINSLEKRVKELEQQISEKDKLLLQLFSNDPSVVSSAHKKLVELETKPLQEKIEQDKPMVEFAETIVESSDTIDIGTLAKLVKEEGIDLGRNRLFKWLREQCMLRRNNQPYQKFIDMKVFEIREYVIKTPFGEMNKTQTLVTGKGQVYIVNKLKEQLGLL